MISRAIGRAGLSALGVLLLLSGAALLAPSIAPFNPFDPGQVSLADGKMPPAWLDGGSGRFLLGTDPQGRDLISVILYGARLSVLISVLAVGFGLLTGASLGMLAGFRGGWAEVLILRVAEVQLTIPALLMAIIISGIIRTSVVSDLRETLAFWAVVFAIGLTNWPQFARVACKATAIESGKDYIAAARLLGLPAATILRRHILPNILRPLMVLSALDFATAIIAEATLSFLGQGMPPTTPSLGTLIRIGNDFLYSGLWWIILFPALYLIALVLSANALADWLREHLDPKF